MYDVNAAEQNRAMFLRWVKVAYPSLYEKAATDARSTQLSGLFDNLISNVSKAVDTISTAAPQLVQQYAQTREQLSLLKTNVQRAKDGLPPLAPTGQQITAAQLQAAEAKAVKKTNTGVVILLCAGIVFGGYLAFKE